jgi:hypothetical protein
MDSLRLSVTEMEDIFGVHDISQGRLPRRATSGVALSILEEKDQTIINPLKDSYTAAMQRHFSIALGIAKEEFPEERVMKILGKEGQYEVSNWKSSDIESIEDVKILKDSTLPSSRSAKFELGINLMTAGIVDRDGALKIMGLDSISDLNKASPEASDQMMAHWENAQMAKGSETFPSDIENTQVHLKIHKAYIQAHPELPDEVKAIMSQHVQLTEAISSLQKMPNLTSPQTPANLGAGGGLPAPQGSPPEEDMGEGLEL